MTREYDAEVGLQRARAASRLLFGNQDRLEVAAAVGRAEVGGVYAQAIALTTGLHSGRVGKQLAVLSDAGLLVRMPTVGGGRRVYYERRESPFWDFAAHFLEASGAI
jgi:hypothetical protein